MKSLFTLLYNRKLTQHCKATMWWFSHAVSYFYDPMDYSLPATIL